MCVGNVDRIPVIAVEFPDRAGLFLSEQQAAIGRSSNAVGVVGALPHLLPLRSVRNHSGNRSNRDFTRKPLLCTRSALSQRSRRKESEKQIFRSHRLPPNGFV